ncbi:hypothetical protein [Pengzhenrongella phosphoraccumulans]|uniref:hypothetical protein n=1 Tax=Pengzhenrongella phosphoraccumulans TaxID=3114394 RepID=UPI0038902C23
MTDDLELQRLLREAHDESADFASLEEGLERLHRTRAVQTALAGLHAEQLRDSLRTSRTTLAGGRQRRSSRPVATFSGYISSEDDERSHLGPLRDGL